MAPSRVSEVRERLCDARTSRMRVAVVESFLNELPYTDDPAMARALSMLDGGADESRIAVVARAVGMSERQLERRFRARVGVTPKHYARLRRFERAVTLARQSPSLTAAAIDAGYYDQAHFIRDFRTFVGEAPGAFLKRSEGSRMSDSSNRPIEGRRILGA